MSAALKGDKEIVSQLVDGPIVNGRIEGTNEVALAPTRKKRLRRGLLLEYFTVGWNVLEAVVGLTAGFFAGSVALVGFSLDSIVEASSGSILIWRLRSEERDTRTAEEVERKAIRLVAVAFLALAAYVGGRALVDLVTQSHADESVPGIILAIVSLIVMPVLAWQKRIVARQLDSRALQADSTQTTLCTYLSAFLLVGLVTNGLFGWWWADPLAGLAIAVFAAKEGSELWNAKDLCCR
ncbi:MAG: cation transporter [Actinomycetota bacterium]|nr:cation transporter [Actinomycetota bacterium]